MKNISQRHSCVNSPVSNRSKRTLFESGMIQRCWEERCSYRCDRDHYPFCSRDALRYRLGQYHGLRRALLSYRRLSK